MESKKVIIPFKFLKADLLKYHVPLREKEHDLHNTRIVLVAILKPVCSLVNNRVYSMRVEKIERATHYRIILCVEEAFLLTEEKDSLLRSQLNCLNKWQLVFEQVNAGDDNFLHINVQRIESYNIL